MSEIKRITLLARKPGLSTSDFRHYWAGPHAKLALGMEGITKYVQNRIDKLLWSNTEEAPFDVDGIVELCFVSTDAMKEAQASAIGQKYIPEDEPVFLKGWTLCIVEPLEATTSAARSTKVIVAFHAPLSVRERLGQAMLAWSRETGAAASLDWTVGTAKRARLWAEPTPPSGFLALRFGSVAAAHEALDEGSAFEQRLAPLLSQASAYLIDELTIR